MTIETHLELLIRNYLDGLATDSERTQLEQLLVRDPAAADALAEASRMERSITDLLRGERACLDEAAAWKKLIALDVDKPNPTSSRATAPRAPRPSPLPSPASPFYRTVVYLSTPVRFGLVVATISCISFVLTTAQIPMQTSRAPQAQQTAVEPAPAPAPIAKVVATRNCRWNPGNGAGGRQLEPGRRLDLAEGQVEVAFNDGVHLHFRGPARMDVEQHGLQLQSGAVALRVPEQATGFTVDTPTARIVDLGTEFSVQVDEEQNTDVEVFAGKVIVHALDSRGIITGGPTLLAAHQRARIEAGAQQIARLADREVPSSTAALHAHYPLDEAPLSELVVHDTVAGQHGSLIHQPTRDAAGVHGRAYLFHHSGVAIPPSALQLSDHFTLTLWVKLPKHQDFGRLVDCTNVAGIFYSGYRLVAVDDQISFRLRTRVHGQQLLEHGPVSAGEWVFVAVRYASDDRIQLSVVPHRTTPMGAAQLAANTVYSTTMMGPIEYQDCVSHLAHSLERPAPMHLLRGMLDDVAMFNAILTDDQLVDIYHHGAAAALDFSPESHP